MFGAIDDDSCESCGVTGSSRLGSIRSERREAGSSDLRVVLFGVGADANRPDHFAIDHDRKRALHLDEAGRRRGGDATIVDRIFEILARLFEQGRCSGFARASSTPAVKAA